MSVKFSARAKQKRRNAGEGWVSYNRVLVGNSASKKNVGRNPNFDTDETKLLIQLWGDPKVQRTLITTHKKHSVICQLATQMQEYGYYRSPEEITTRIKNLKCFYNRLKKEIEAGQNTTDVEPSWRHFAEMDAIMTRPIFSVRPNEVPQPSLKYQLEQQREQREERRKQILDEGGALSESEENIDDDLEAISKSSNQDIDDGIIPDVEVDMDINDEAYAALTAAEASSISAVKKLKFTNGDIDSEADDDDDDDEDDEDKSLQIKEEDEEQTDDSNKSAGDGNGEAEHMQISNEAEIKTSCENEEEFIATAKVTTKMDVSKARDNAALIIPKEEPIDVDADYDVNFDKNIKTNVGELMPTLAEMLKMTKPSTTAAISNTTTTSQLLTTFTSGELTTTTSAAATVTATTKISTQSTPGKISLVPASFLLQPKSKTGTNTTATVVGKPTMQLLQSQPQAQLQPRILLSSHGAAGSTQVSNAAGIVTTGPGGMKVLLVNAEQQQQLQKQQAGTHQQQYQKMLQNQQQQHLQQQQIHQQQLQQQQNQQQQQQIQLQQQNAEKPKQKKKFKHQQQLRAIACSTAQKYTNNEDDVGVGIRKEVTGATTRQLIRQVHEMIKENTDIQLKRLQLDTERLESERLSFDIESKRLALDRERFDFERSAFERLLNVFPSILQHTQVPAPAAAAAATTMLFNPSKLLFTTAGGTATFAAGGPTTFATSVPVSGATAVFAPSQNFTAGNLAAVAPMVAPQIEMCTQINELQLLTPKQEKEE